MPTLETATNKESPPVTGCAYTSYQSPRGIFPDNMFDICEYNINRVIDWSSHSADFKSRAAYLTIVKRSADLVIAV